MQGQVATIRIEAPPEAVWDVVSDVTRTGEWSPVCYRCEWIDGATGPAAGARFRGHNKLRGVRWSRDCEILEADRPGVFAFRTLLKGRESTRWRYELRASDGGTEVTESYEPKLAPMYVRIVRLLAAKSLDADAKRNLDGSLARLKAVVEGT
jgi:hypothetical protein